MKQPAPKASNEGDVQQTRYQDAAARNGGARKHDDMMQMSFHSMNNVTPEDVQLATVYDPGAKREGLRASSNEHLPK